MFTPLGSYDRFGLVNFRIAGQTAGEVGIPGGGPISGPEQIPGDVGVTGAADVPEPTTSVLCVIGMLLLLAGRRVRRRRAGAG